MEVTFYIVDETQLNNMLLGGISGLGELKRSF